MTIRELLEKEGISENEALREQALLIALSRISRYEAESAALRAKYGAELDEMKARSDSHQNGEDFSFEDDLTDWEYAVAALTWWRQHVEELRSAA